MCPRSGPELLSFCPESSGFKLLLRLMATPKAKLGFRLSAEPPNQSLGQYGISELQLLCYGMAPQGHGSQVYRVTAESTDEKGPATLKLHNLEKEVRTQYPLCG